MKHKKIVTAILLYTMTSGVIFALPKSGEVIGRDLNMFPFGWIGHLAMVTGDNVFRTSNIIIEATPGPGIQFNSFTSFLNASPFWGAKFGVVDDPAWMYQGLVAAKLQSYWCPKYSATLQYRAGEGWLDGFGNPHPTVCSMWRCDTLVGFVHARAGNLMLLNYALSPAYTFSLFPYFDTGLSTHKYSGKVLSQQEADEIYLKTDPEELKNIPGEELLMILDIRNEDKSPERISKDWVVINSPGVHIGIKQLLLDAHSLSQESELISKLLAAYNATKSDELKAAIIKATMIYYQGNWNQIKSSSEFETLKAFYEETLKNKPSKESSPDITRGYIDFHSESDIQANKFLIDAHLKAVDQKPAIGLEFELIRKSPSLEKVYFPKMIDALESENNSEVEGMFAYIMNHGFIDNATPESKKLLKSHIEKIQSDNSMKTTELDDYFKKESTVDFNELQTKLK